MDRNEFHRRRRALEELYQADLRLLRAAHEARVRSLEALWLTLEGDALPAPLAALPSAPEPALLEPDDAPALPAAPALPPRKPDLRTALEDLLPSLPDLFEKKDVIQALGWTPSRSSLQRVLSEMEMDGLLGFEVLSSGRMPSRYRKVPTPTSPGHNALTDGVEVGAASRRVLTPDPSPVSQPPPPGEGRHHPKT